MRQDVNLQYKEKRAIMRRRRALARRLLLWIGLGTGVNWLLLQLNIPFRVYLSAGLWYYVNLLPGCRWIAALLCALSLGVSLFGSRLRLAFWIFAADTLLLTAFAVLLVDNPLCCLPELAVHSLILFLLRRGFVTGQK